MSVDKKITVFVLLLALCALAAGIYAGWSRPVTTPEVNFIGVRGDQFAMSSLKGKVVLVNFWATSCTVCVSEMSKMVQTYEKYREQGLETVAVAMSYDPPDRVFAYRICAVSEYFDGFDQRTGDPTVDRCRLGLSRQRINHLR